MRRSVLLLTLFVVAVGLAGCGYKGPLTPPPAAPQPAAAATAPAPAASVPATPE